MRFRIKAIGPNATLVETELEAGSEAEVRALAQTRGLSVLTLKSLVRGPGRSRFPLLLFNQELLALLRAGISLAEAVAALAEKESRPAVRAVLADVLQALREGRSLSSALEAAPHAFPDLYVAMIRAAERTSDLDQAVARFIAHQQEENRLRDKLVSALIYPLLLVGVGGLVVLFLLGYVVPRFSHIYEDVGSDLPFMSRLLLDWGQFVEAHAMALGLVALATLAAGLLLARSPAVRVAVGRRLWRMPFVGERMRVFQLARFYRTVGMLLSGGIPVVTALGMVSGLLSPMLRVGLAAAIASIREGRSFSSTLAARGLTTPVALRMLEVGERAGNLGEMLTRAAEFHEEDTARQMEWVTRLFGPLLMLLIGCAIGLIVVLMYLPIFQLAESIG
ncbi:MAG: type II secretion system F family protein [Aromatoleum sp.]|jgi:general secretion pathway protein F|uniref:type II secretion system F family protein n=1 Tax=Aromatoleum sp. TaxID=2307007 RepID=UPI002893970A|nr:type II secretion system F family protein [Aromatoleum sp.]MDT3672258.1 type II secretion system F family protein [Aromatoleum sp.]